MTSHEPRCVLPVLLLMVGAALTSGQGCGGSSKGGVDGGDSVGTGGMAGTGADGSAGNDASPIPSCGQPGTQCCDGNSCTGGGCCVSGICMAQGTTCATFGGICSAGACGNCGSPGQACCGVAPATGVCTSPGTICSAGTCMTCGDLGKGCCASASGGGGSCNGPNAMCSGDGVCVACGTPGSACCVGNRCDSPGCCYNSVCTGEGSLCGASGGTCQAGRCSACGGASQPCCANVCYEGLVCKGGTCAGCGGLGQSCCAGSTATPACQAGMACSGAGGVCTSCGNLGDTCCAGNACRAGCCSGGVCLAPGTGACPIGSPDGGGQVDAPMGGDSAGGAGGTHGRDGGGTTGSGGTGGAGGGTTLPWTPPVGCGDGVVVSPEQCDDHNTLPFDGCSSDCQNEPICTDGACTSRCGDGIVLGEQCDDGNAINGDGCSSTCTVEPGWTCAQPDIGDRISVPVVYRDFKFSKDMPSGNDFERGVTGSYSALVGIVNATLGPGGKPVYSGAAGRASILSADSFAQWFVDTAGVNHSTATKMTLWNDGKGNYVNRYGANGEQWPLTEKVYFCGYVGAEALDDNGVKIPCTWKLDSGVMATDCDKELAKGLTMLKCEADSSGTYQGTFIVNLVDGNPLFFPVDGDPFTPASELTAATISPYYDGTATWPFDTDAKGTKRLHNFSFTSEIHYWFKYDKTKTYTLDFVGDDDAWVFINRKLAVDLGGIHTPVDGKLVIGADGNGTTTVTETYPPGMTPVPTKQSASLGLEDGKVYEIAVFQAERQTNGSSYKLTLGGFNTAPSKCHAH